MKFVDKFGRIIILTDDGIKHIYKHPEMQNKLYLVENTIKFPDSVEEDLYRSRIYYYKYIKQEKRNVMIATKLINNKGYVLTAYLVEK